MLSRLLTQPHYLQSLRQFTLSSVNSARSAFRRGSGSSFGQFTATFKEAFTSRQAVPSFRERLLGPTTGKPFIYGTYALAGSSVFGIGMLCYYGLTMNAESALARSALWPDYVRERLNTTYAYLAGSLSLTAAAGMAAARSPAILAMTSGPSLFVWFGSLAAILATGIIVQSIDYSNTLPKHIAWAAHCTVLGAVIAPLCYLGGPVLIRAAWYTAAIVGGLSVTAMCAPSEKFLNMAGPLAMGLGVVFVACLGSFAFPPNTALGAGLASIVIYGGLILFSAFLLHDTQRVIKMAQGYQVGRFGAAHHFDNGSLRNYDPINSQLSIYMDILNIFMRMAMIMGGGQRRK
jgi:FtsH-binding integral membrane protein